ncbi:hypothetical protein HLB42_20475 (plasmid) [Deinococcus sp. D7000]|nr:hypothetical protein HLB42_20475 [Deinococcus sp. D7000]
MTQTEINAFVQSTGVMPSSNHVLLLIDGASDRVYRIEQKASSGVSAQSAGYTAVPEDDVQFNQTALPLPAPQANVQPQALVTCSTSTTQEGAYYRNAKLGGIGWDFDAILPYDTTNIGPHVYGGYQTSGVNSVNMEVGLQYNTGNIWQTYIRIAQNGNSEYAPVTGGTYSTKGWKMDKYYFANGDTVHYQTRSYISSDGAHYITGQFSTPNKSYTVGYKGTATGATWNVSSLRPSNAANITVRKVISLADPVTGSKIVNAKIRNATYLTSSGASLTWPNNYACANYGTSRVTYDNAAPAGGDTVTIQ